jgi:hypothetical protein
MLNADIIYAHLKLVYLLCFALNETVSEKKNIKFGPVCMPALTYWPTSFHSLHNYGQIVRVLFLCVCEWAICSARVPVENKKKNFYSIRKQIFQIFSHHIFDGGCKAIFLFFCLRKQSTVIDEKFSFN